MKRSGPLKRKTPLRAKTPLRRTGIKKKATRTKLPAVSTTRNKADKLLTPIIKAQFKKCLLCPFAGRNNDTQVAHHHVHKSQSTRLRYELDNLIPLCNPCHQMLHNNESYWASKIVQLRGIEWFEKLERMKHETVKADVHFYLAAIERLTAHAATINGYAGATGKQIS